MEPLTAVDRLVLILRQRLQARQRGAAASRRPGVERLDAAAALRLATLEGEILERTLIQTLLMDQLGAGLVNDPRFQRVVTQVTDAITESPDGRALMAAAVRELRAARAASSI